MSIKARGIDLEMLTVRGILRALERLPVERRAAVLDYVVAHLKTAPIEADMPFPAVPQVNLFPDPKNGSVMTGPTRKG